MAAFSLSVACRNGQRFSVEYLNWSDVGTGLFVWCFAQDGPFQLGEIMANKTSKSASRDVKRAMHERKEGTLKGGRSGQTVKSRKQAVAIGLSEARRKGKRVPLHNGSRIEEMATEAWQNAGSMKYALGIGLAGAAIGLLSVWAARQAGR